MFFVQGPLSDSALCKINFLEVDFSHLSVPGRVVISHKVFRITGNSPLCIRGQAIFFGLGASMAFALTGRDVEAVHYPEKLVDRIHSPLGGKGDLFEYHGPDTS